MSPILLQSSSASPITIHSQSLTPLHWCIRATDISVMLKLQEWCRITICGAYQFIFAGQSAAIDLAHPDERMLGLHLLQFAEVRIFLKILLSLNDFLLLLHSSNQVKILSSLLQIVEDACTSLLPHLVCEYLYNISEDFTKFYTNCQVWNFPTNK